VIAVSEGTPALYNDPELMARVVPTLQRAFGEENVSEAKPSMGGEDFSRYGLAGVPICMFRLGAVSQSRLDEFKARDEPPPSLHSPVFYPDAEAALRVGVPAMVAIALDLLPPPDAPASGE
jgi:hippurate hydrolase